MSRPPVPPDPASADVAGCQVYAIVEAGPGAADRLSALLAAVPLTSLRIDPLPGQSLTAALAKPLVDLAQSRDCAALICEDATLARTLRADGVHLTAGDDLLHRYAEARAVLGGGAIVGVDAGGSRHEAMEAGEAGADYVAFSAPPVTDETELSGLADVDDLITWWAEVFEVPCVALAHASEEAAPRAAEAGADFVALHFASGEPMAEAVARLRRTVARLGGRHAS